MLHQSLTDIHIVMCQSHDDEDSDQTQDQHYDTFCQILDKCQPRLTLLSHALGSLRIILHIFKA